MKQAVSRAKRGDRKARASQLSVEVLEPRSLLSGATPALPVLLQPVPNETLDQAAQIGNASAQLGDLTLIPTVEALGSIGTGSAGSADVAWYQFTLDTPAAVSLSAAGRTGGTPFQACLGLYNSDSQDFSDQYDPDGHRLLAQVTGSAAINRELAAGTYYIAVSGAGNRSFYPFLAESGTAGSTGNYELHVTSTNLGFDPSGTPLLLAVDVTPQIVRLDLSAPLDPNAVATLTDSQGNTLNLLWSNFSTNALELQLAPSRALAPGAYHVTVTDGLGQTILTASVSVPATPDGASDGTPATAQNLGDVTGVGLVQVSGTIGGNPHYDAASPDPTLNPGNQVNLYHFTISGPDRYALVAEVFAGRIDSPLSAGISLFELDPNDQTLHFVAGNSQTDNPTLGTDGTIPLFLDPALSAGLTAGDYYLAVSSGVNTPSPDQGQTPGPDSGIFDPNVPYSGSVGWSVGPYVLNVLAYRTAVQPTVVAASITPGETLTAPPVTLTVRFNEPVNLSQLAFDAYQQTSQDTVSAVYIEWTDPATGLPVKYFPRLNSYDPATNQATFLMLDGLANGDYQLHLSGADGLTDQADNPLAGNDPSGDYVIPFQVAGAARGVNGSPLVRADQGSNSILDQPQQLGILYPHELQSGVILSASFTPDTANTPANEQHYYSFQVLQSQSYFVGLTGSNLPPDINLTLYDSDGNVLDGSFPSRDGPAMNVQLDPGTYVIGVSWTNGLPDALNPIDYQLLLSLQGNSDNPPPLLSGPAPAVQIRLDSAPLLAAPFTPPIVVLPPVNPISPAVTDSTTPGANGVTTAEFHSATPTFAPSSAGSANGLAPGGTLIALGEGPVGKLGNGNAANNAPTVAPVAIRLPSASDVGRLGEILITLQPGRDFGDIEPRVSEATPSGDPVFSQLCGQVLEMTDRFLGSLGSMIETIPPLEARAEVRARQANPQYSPPDVASSDEVRPITPVLENQSLPDEPSSLETEMVRSRAGVALQLTLALGGAVAMIVAHGRNWYSRRQRCKAVKLPRGDWPRLSDSEGENGRDFQTTPLV